MRLQRGALTLRVEVLNVFNHADFTGPNIQFGGSSFGQIVSVTGFPRTLQLMVRWRF